MAKPTKRPLSQIEAYARRRGGGNYIAAATGIKDRLEELRRNYKNVPAAYRGYLLVGICTCLESHIKYSYAHAAERFIDKPDVLRALFKDISVDIDTLISTSRRSFHLADVIAANIKVSSLDAYTGLASAFFTALDGKPHSFPRDLDKVFGNGDGKEGAEALEAQLARLRQVFAMRHDYVHETLTDEMQPGTDPLLYIDDALHLFNLFDKHLENIEIGPQYNDIFADEGLHEAAARHEEIIKGAFENIRQFCEPRQYAKLDEFRDKFIEYLWARSAFSATVFVVQQSESAVANFLDLAPTYFTTLVEVAEKQRYLLAKYPTAEQEAELLGGFEDEPDQPDQV